MIPRFNSLLTRIIWLHIIALGMAAVAVPVMAYLILDSSAENFENRTLRAHADTIAEYLEVKADGSVALNLPADLRTFYSHGFGGFAFAVIEGSGRTLFSSLPTGLPVLGNVPRAGRAKYFQRSSKTVSYFAGSIPEREGKKTLWIQITQNLQHPDVIIDDVVSDFIRRVAWFTIPIILVVLVVDIIVVQRALRPVIAASESAKAIDPNRLDLRLPSQNLPSEVLPLIETINQALSRLENGFRIQREFTADAAHELRTPLSVLRMRIDNLRDQDAAKSLGADMDTMSHVVDQLLDVAELEGTVVTSDEIADLQRVCSDVVEFIAPWALSQERDISLTGSETPVRVRGNASMLFQAIRNLVENAVRYAPKGSTVEVSVEEEGVVRVLDEGPGVPEDERELVFRRFWRRDRSSTAGAGLGLAIVARVAEAHMGSVKVDNRLTGGAIFSLDLVRARLMENATKA